MAEDMFLPLLGYNGDDEEDDTTDSDGKSQLRPQSALKRFLRRRH